MQTTATTVAPARRTFLVTLVLAYTGFVALGLANSLMGVAWPSVSTTFGMPIDALGILLIGNTAGYMVASASSGRLIARLSIGTVLAGSCGIAALALLGSGGAPSWAALVVLSVVYGLSGGAIDTGLNSYAAEHFSPRAMNWLHACFGIGATLGPAIMTIVLTNGLSWRAGFVIAGAAQVALVVGFAVTRSSWRGHSAPGAATQPAVPSAPLGETLRLPLVWLGIVLFFVYCGAEVGTGQWIYSLLTKSRGVSEAVAGTWASIYWASLTVGRILFGIVVGRVSPTKLLRWSMVGALLAALLIWLNSVPWLTFGGIALMGLALAPQFPLLISATPRYLGLRHAANGIGFQVASASLGGGLLPGLIGVLARITDNLEVLGPCLFVIVVIMTGLFELLARHMPAGDVETGR